MFDLEVEHRGGDTLRSANREADAKATGGKMRFSAVSEPEEKNGTYPIHAYEKDKCLCIDVRTTGIGIPEEKIPELLNHSEKLKGDQMSSIDAKCGQTAETDLWEEYGLSVESRVGEYTQITVRIPLEY